MIPLAYTTSKISWWLLKSAISRVQPDSSKNLGPIDDLNLEALSCIVLSCVALEAFVNEISSLTYAFLFDFEQENKSQLEIDNRKNMIGIDWQKCQKAAQIKDDTAGSFYDRYKLLLGTFSVEQPDFLQRINSLKELRNTIAHYKKVDIPIVDDTQGIRYQQNQPEVFQHLKNLSFQGHPIISSDGEDGSVEWTLRISTPAMATWCIDLVLDAIIYFLNTLPHGSLKDFIVKAYLASDKSFANVFEKGKSDIKL